MTITEVLPSGVARTELPRALARFRAEGESAEPVVFGSHRRPEAVVIPFELYSQLLPAIEEIEIARIVRERSQAGEPRPLADLAESIGLDPADFA